jgi:hypothetical protein
MAAASADSCVYVDGKAMLHVKLRDTAEAKVVTRIIKELDTWKKHAQKDTKSGELRCHFDVSKNSLFNDFQLKSVVDLIIKNKLYPISFHAAKCNLTDASCADLARLLNREQQSAPVMEMVLSGNKITNKGWPIIMDAVRESTAYPAAGEEKPFLWLRMDFNHLTGVDELVAKEKEHFIRDPIVYNPKKPTETTYTGKLGAIGKTDRVLLPYLKTQTQAEEEGPKDSARGFASAASKGFGIFFLLLAVAGVILESSCAE